MGEKPAHIPKTQAKLMYDSDALYIIFRVEDKYICAVARHQGNVCRDSCVEFFFTPSEDIETRYFNLETNCGGLLSGTCILYIKHIERSEYENQCKLLDV